jgi:hypothetical protein
MASIAAELITYLKTKSGITSLVGTSTNARIYHDKPKQGVAFPQLVVARISGAPTRPLSGASQISTATIEIESIAETRAGADALADAVFIEMGPDDKTMGSTSVTEIVTEVHADTGDYLPQDASDKSLYWSRSRYTLWYYPT